MSTSASASGAASTTSSSSASAKPLFNVNPATAATSKFGSVLPTFAQHMDKANSKWTSDDDDDNDDGDHDNSTAAVDSAPLAANHAVATEDLDQDLTDPDDDDDGDYDDNENSNQQSSLPWTRVKRRHTTSQVWWDPYKNKPTFKRYDGKGKGKNQPAMKCGFGRACKTLLPCMCGRVGHYVRHNELQTYRGNRQDWRVDSNKRTIYGESNTLDSYSVRKSSAYGYGSSGQQSSVAAPVRVK